MKHNLIGLKVIEAKHLNILFLKYKDVNMKYQAALLILVKNTEFLLKLLYIVKY